MTGVVGKVIQYMSVGTFRVVSPAFESGWYYCEPIKVPKRYRDNAKAHGGMLVLYVTVRDVIDEQ